MKFVLRTVIVSFFLSTAAYAGTCQTPENLTGKICKIDNQNFRILLHNNDVKTVDATLRKFKLADSSGFSSLVLKSKCGTLKFVIQPKDNIATLMNSAMIKRRGKCDDVGFDSIDTSQWYFEDLTK